MNNRHTDDHKDNNYSLNKEDNIIHTAINAYGISDNIKERSNRKRVFT